MKDKMKKIPQNVLGLIFSIPVAVAIYFVSLSTLSSDPNIFLVCIFGLAIPSLVFSIILQRRYKEIFQYKNFDPNSKLPQCTVASISAMVSGLGIAESIESIPDGLNVSLVFSFISILLLGSFTILSISDSHGSYVENPNNIAKIRDDNNKLQKERWAIFIKDFLCCLIAPFLIGVLFVVLR